MSPEGGFVSYDSEELRVGIFEMFSERTALGFKAMPFGSFSVQLRSGRPPRKPKALCRRVSLCSLCHARAEIHRCPVRT